MTPEAKQALLEYSRRPKDRAGVFKGMQKFEEKQTFLPSGKVITEWVEVPRWETGRVITWIRNNGRRMALDASEQGWHMRLIDFVAHQHRLPSETEIDWLVLQQQLINETRFPESHYKRVERIKKALCEPLALKMTG